MQEQITEQDALIRTRNQAVASKITNQLSLDVIENTPTNDKDEKEKLKEAKLKFQRELGRTIQLIQLIDKRLKNYAVPKTSKSKN